MLYTLKNLHKYTPATTMVEECNKLDTGVGPSMAFGNHELKNAILDFVITATTIKKVLLNIIKAKIKKSLTRFIIMAIQDLF